MIAGMKRIPCIGVALVLLVSSARSETTAPDSPLSLWYRQPAGDWVEALPVGNGRLGAMVFGGVPEERIQFNEDTIWTGKPHSYARDGAVKALPEIRRLLQDGRAHERRGLDLAVQADRLKADGDASAAVQKRQESKDALTAWSTRQKAAEELGMKEFMSDPIRQKTYQPGGDLRIAFPGQAEAVDYRRWLDLDAAMVTTEYRIGDVLHRREVMASLPDDCIVIRLTADRSGQVACRLGLDSPHGDSSTRVDAQQRLVLQGQVQRDGIRFEAWAEVSLEGGRMSASTETLEITGADAVTIRLVAASNFQNFRSLDGDPAARCADALARSPEKGWPALLSDHQRDHRNLFRRVSLDLGSTPASRLPTDERIAGFGQGNDPDLATLAFQYGRYLLIASSRIGGQPANLQGLWNHSMKPPWDSKYTTNINAEMNYWPALVANLAECQIPMFDALDELVISGRETAAAHYGLDGWVLHHNYDLWRGTAPINHSNHGIWPTGGAWLAHQLWEHYLYTRDEGFLRERGYPVMRGAAQFLADYLVEDLHTGWLISGPSNSPENGGLVMGPTMDHQIIRSLFQACVESARVLDTDAAFATRLRGLIPRIVPNQVGRHGQLQEWTEDKDDPGNKHRHVSHMWGVHPGADITWQQPEFFDAVRQSLLFRGDEATGWSMGWKINLWARFLDGDHAYRIVGNLLRPAKSGSRQRGGMYPNLFDAHPPFQIDGNFGYTAGIAEMMVQSHVVDDGAVVIHLLPALPKVWSTGEVRGLRVRGGAEIEAAWQDGALSQVRILPDDDATFVLRYGDVTRPLTVHAGAPVILDHRLK